MGLPDKILTAVIIATVMYIFLILFLDRTMAAGIAAAATALIVMLFSQILKKE